MSELTFEKFAKSLTDAPLLEDAQVSEYIAAGKMQPVMLYCYRIAAYAAQELRTSGKMPEATDDTDYIDAVQECIPHVPGLVASWSKKKTHKFSTYVNAALRNVISHYLWELAKGGMGAWHSDAPQIEQFPEEIQEDDELDNETYYGDSVIYTDPPFGFRDPITEASAMQDFEEVEQQLSAPLPRTDRGLKTRINNA